MDPNQEKVKLKRLPEPANNEELLRFWLLHAHKGRDRHDLAARRDNSYHYWLGVPAFILAAIVGTAIFASFSTGQATAQQKTLVGLISITSAVLSNLQTFYNFPNKAESHRTAGVKYKAVIRELEQILTHRLQSLPKNKDFYDDLRKRLDDLELESPVVPEGIYRRIEGNYERTGFIENAPRPVK